MSFRGPTRVWPWQVHRLLCCVSSHWPTPLVRTYLAGNHAKTETSFRYGGDEFMILLPETSIPNAETRGIRFKAAFNEMWRQEWSAKPACPEVTMSIGVAELDQVKNADALSMK